MALAGSCRGKETGAAVPALFAEYRTICAAAPAARVMLRCVVACPMSADAAIYRWDFRRELANVILQGPPRFCASFRARSETVADILLWLVLLAAWAPAGTTERGERVALAARQASEPARFPNHVGRRRQRKV